MLYMWPRKLCLLDKSGFNIDLRNDTISIIHNNVVKINIFIYFIAYKDKLRHVHQNNVSGHCNSSKYLDKVSELFVTSMSHCN